MGDRKAPTPPPTNQTKPTPPPAPPAPQPTAILVGGGPGGGKTNAVVHHMNTDEDDHWRLHAAHKARLETPAKATPVWVARELVYFCTATEPRNAFYIVLRMPLGTDYAATSPRGGRRVMRLLYEWRAIEPYLHLSPSQLRDVLQEMATSGNILRAGLAYAASGRNGPGV